MRKTMEVSMRRILIAAAIVLVLAAGAAAQSGKFDRYFEDGCLRVDLYHTGRAEVEIFSVDQIIREPYWGGNPRSLVDTLNLGQYLLRVFDARTNDLIFSRGYSSIFGEWITTDEAMEGESATFHETLVMPFPRGAVQIRIDRRDRENRFVNVFDTVIDPSGYHVTTENRYSGFRARTLIKNGPPPKKVDIVILGDGYPGDRIHKLREDAETLLAAFFEVEPFKSRKEDFNVRLIECVSAGEGVDNPREGVFRDNILGLSFNSLDLDRYMVVSDNRTVRDMAAKVPYDNIILLANEKKYGGGGIFNLYSAGISDNQYSEYVFIHEFGHAFAGLADEYFSSKVTYNDMYPRGVEPWEPNITALLDKDNVKWKELMDEGTPVPTPDDSTCAGVTGCFEGAGYSAKGLYRSYRDCIMFSKDTEQGFCPACRAAIERMIDFKTR